MSGLAAPGGAASWTLGRRSEPEPSRLRRLAGRILERCRGEGPANCVARCPLHVDARGYVRLTREGRYREALAAGPGEAARSRGFSATSAPTRASCTASESTEDNAIRIRDIKRFLAEHEAGEPRTSGSRSPRRGPDGRGRRRRTRPGLMAAHDLARLGYRVTAVRARSRDRRLPRAQDSRVAASAARGRAGPLGHRRAPASRFAPGFAVGTGCPARGVAAAVRRGAAVARLRGRSVAPAGRG